MTTLKKYKKFWDKKAFDEEIAREKLRTQALNICDKLKNILVKEFSVGKVILFGSILDTGRFEKGSDIDMAVAGLPKKLYFRALARLMMASPFEIDLKPIEDVKGLIIKRIAKGKVLYEKRENP